MGKTTCELCKKKCKGQAMKIDEKYFHLKCFKCKECKKPLGGPGAEFFLGKDPGGGDGGKGSSGIFCAEDYRNLYGTKCFACKKFVEGDVVTVLGHTYHPACLHCTACNASFGPGDRVTFDGARYICGACLDELRRKKDVVIVLAPTSKDAAENAVPAKAKSSVAPKLEDSVKERKINGYLNAQPRRDEPISPVVVFPSHSLPKYGRAKSWRASTQSPTGDQNALNISTRTSGYRSDQSSNLLSDEPVGDLSNETFERNSAPASPHGLQREVLSPVHNFDSSFGSAGSRHEVDYSKFYKISFLDRELEFKKGPSINLSTGPVKTHFHRPANFSYRKFKKDLGHPLLKGIVDTLCKCLHD